jgi:hypothetical protein
MADYPGKPQLFSNSPIGQAQTAITVSHSVAAHFVPGRNSTQIQKLAQTVAHYNQRPTKLQRKIYWD